MAFDYEAETLVDAVLFVADSIRSSCRLAPLTDEQKLQRRIDHEIFRAEQRQRDQERQAEQEYRQAVADEAARQEAAIERAELNRQARLARSAEIERQTREIELRDLRQKVTQQDWWQKSVDRAANNAIQQRYTQTLMGQLDAMINPPQPEPPPEPTEVVVVKEEQGPPRLGYPDLHRWF